MTKIKCSGCLGFRESVYHENNPGALGGSGWSEYDLCEVYNIDEIEDDFAENCPCYRHKE